MKISGFLLRWLFALALVFATYNPTGYSLTHWVWPFGNEQLPLKFLFCLLALVCYVVYLTATFRSLGWLGIILIVAFCGAMVWLLVDMGWLQLNDSGVFAWLSIFILGLIMGLGMSWSHIKKRLSGQFDTDDIGD